MNSAKARQAVRVQAGCAHKLVAAALLGEVETDWLEVKRLAQDSAYQNWPDVMQLVYEQAQALQVGSPYHPHD